MARETVDPTRSKKDPLHGVSVKHPSFAAIGASRCQGGNPKLFGSKVHHHGHVRIQITEATLYEGDYEERIHGGTKVIAEVAMSEAQWVAFISRMNIGAGTPCTLLYTRDGDLVQVPEVPDQESHVERMKRFVDSMSDAHREHLQKSVDAIRAVCETLPKGKAKDILDSLQHMTGTLFSNLDFSKKMLTEHSEKATAEAKIEIDSFVKGMVTQLGVDSLQDLVAALPEKMKNTKEVGHEGE